jgi:hypothetical protein
MGNPQFHAQMKAKANEPSIAGAIGKIGCGGFMALGCGFGLVAAGYQGFAVSAMIGLFLGLFVAMVVSGGAGLGKKKLPIAAFLGVAAVVAIISTFAGPPMGTAFAKSEEKEAYEKLKKDMKNDYFEPERWKWDYVNKVDEKFQRPEWEGQYFIARVAKAKRDDIPGDLRTILAEIDEKEDIDDDAEKLFDKARDDAKEAFNEYYEEAQKVLYKDVKGNREFPVDPALRKAFSTILDDLAGSTDGNVYVAFENNALLKKPEGADEMLKQERSVPGRRNGQVIQPAEAFSPSYDEARRATFMKAMNESFRQVFKSDGLLNLVPLGKGDDKKDKIVFQVSSKIVRMPTYFIFTTNNIFKGFLFAIEVEWGFKIIDRSGKELYAPPSQRSSPAKDLKVGSSPGDPDWAMYSVMMDSAYYNYSREMTGKFGLTPPPVKGRFDYVKPKKGKSLR